MAEFLDNMSFLQAGGKAVCWLSAHSQQPPNTLDKYHILILFTRVERVGLLWIYLPLEAGVNIAFQALPGSSFSMLLHISAPAAASRARLRRHWGSARCLCAPTDGLWTVLPQNPQQLFLPSWQQLLVSCCPPAPIPVPCPLSVPLPRSQHPGMDLPSHCSAGSFIQPGALCALNWPWRMFQSPLCSPYEEHREQEESPGSISMSAVWQHTWVMNRARGEWGFVYLSRLFLHYLRTMMGAAKAASAASPTKTPRQNFPGL